MRCLSPAAHSLRLSGPAVSGFPRPLRHLRHERVEPRGGKRERLPLLGALIGRHQHLHHFDAVVEGQQRPAPRRGTPGRSGGSRPRSRTPRLRLATTGIKPDLGVLLFHEIFAARLPVTSRLKNSLSPLSSVFQAIEYSGPSSSAESRSPAPTKLQRRRRLADRGRPSGVSNSIIDAGEVLGRVPWRSRRLPIVFLSASRMRGATT